MEYRPLGRTGVQVSPLCLGAMMFGPWGNDDRSRQHPHHPPRPRRRHQLRRHRRRLLRRGISEEIVGEALQGRRDDVFLATKFFMPMSDDPNQRGGSRRWIMREVENSLRRLNTDYIDLYQVHRPSPDTDVEETLGALTDLVRQGKVRYIGSSSYSGSQIVEAQWASRERNLERFVTEQPPYSILVRGIEEDVLPTIQRHGMGSLTYSPLGGGWLSGRWRKDCGVRAHLIRPPSRPLRHEQPGQPAQARHRRGARPARRAGRPQPHRARDRVRHQPPGGHRGDRRTAHDGTAGVVPARRRTSC